jgi:hypothetical protein
MIRKARRFGSVDQKKSPLRQFGLLNSRKNAMTL